MDVQDLVATVERAIQAAGPEVSVEGVEAGEREILNEASQLAWRALALSQELHERYGGAPLAPGAKLSAK